MARSPTAAAAPGQAKPKRNSRPAGPRTLYLLLQDGTDPNSFRSQIKQATFNGRVVLAAMEGGSTPSVVKLTINSGRGNGAGVEEEVQVEQATSAGDVEQAVAAE